MIKILILQGFIPHYRIPFFNELSGLQDVSITILHSGNIVTTSKCKFKEIVIKAQKIGRIRWQTGLIKLVNQYDVVIVMFDLAWLSNIQLIILKKWIHPSIILWGQGYGKNTNLNKFRTILAKKADALLLYCESRMQPFVDNGIILKKIFIAPNTIFVSNGGRNWQSNRFEFLFVGRLRPEKKIDQLFYAFAAIKDILPKKIKITLIGSGTHKNQLLNLSLKLGINKKINFVEETTDEHKLKPFFDSAIAYISPGDVGLGVLHSFAYGVPVVTSSTASRHGPEYSNIKNGFNGLIYDGEVESLSKIMIQLVDNTKMARELGRNAFEFYQNERQIKHMVNGVKEAINYSINVKNIQYIL